MSPNSPGNGHPVMFGHQEANHFGKFPDGGGYPLRFLTLAYDLLGVTDPEQVLHLCSGSMQVGVRVDVRLKMRPTVVADSRSTPFRDESFRWILIDPPYSKEWADNLYGTGGVFPSSSSLLREATRLLIEHGRVGFLHFMVPYIRKPLRGIAVRGVTTGAGANIRAFSVFEKDSWGTGKKSVDPYSWMKEEGLNV